MTGQSVSVADIRTGGVWTLSGGRAIIAEPDGPATLLVPSESVLLLGVDLPLGNHTKRLAALPFAIEDRIADPIESVHLALGSEIAPKRYLVAVVRHALMREWIEIAETEGLGHAALVPDALALPVPETGWSVEAADGRVLVRGADGAGFAASSTLIGQIWEAAGRPRIWNCGSVPIGELPQEPRPAGGGGLAERLTTPAIDLRQGAYARPGGAGGGSWLKRLGWIAAAGIAAHVVIAGADTLMLRTIAERRADDTRAAVAQAAPGANLGEDLRVSVADMLPPPGAAGSQFVPLVTRTSNALAPLSSAVTARSMRFEGNTLVMEIEPGEPGLADRVRAAMRAAGVTADVAAGQDGAVRLTVRA